LAGRLWERPKGESMITFIIYNNLAAAKYGLSGLYFSHTVANSIKPRLSKRECGAFSFYELTGG